VASCVTVCGAGGATSIVIVVVAPPIASDRAAIRGRRTPPARIRRDGFRSSAPPGRIEASARLTKSTGTYQVRPSRAGAAGSEIIRPETDASGCCVESTIVCGPDVTIRPPAAASSRTVRLKSRARSSSANISWPPIVRAGSGRRASRVTTV
jgi:hypothetical protein